MNLIYIEMFFFNLRNMKTFILIIIKLINKLMLIDKY